MSVPRKDSVLAAWGTNFGTRISAAPVPLGLTAAMATEFDDRLQAFLTAYAAANSPGSRSKSLVTAKDAAKDLLVDYARGLYGLVQANPNVSDAEKDLLGIVVRSAPTPQPPPIVAPGTDIVSVSGRRVKVRLHDSASSTKRGKPVACLGANVYSFVGASYPSDPSAWQWEGSTTSNNLEVVFPDTVADNAQVWFCAAWFNFRTVSGPISSPITTYLQKGITSEVG